MVWSPFDRRPPARAVPANIYAPPRLPAGVSYAFRSSPYQAYQPPYGLLTAHLWPDPPPPQGGLLDPFAGGDELDAHAGRAPGARIEPMPAHLRGIAPGPEGGFIGMMIQESWPEEAHNTSGHSTLGSMAARFNPSVVNPSTYRAARTLDHAQWPSESLPRPVADRRDLEPHSSSLSPEEVEANHAWLDAHFSPDSAENGPRAAIIDMPGGPYLALNPVSGKPWTIDATKPPRFTPQRAKEWHVPEVESPGGAEGRQSAGSAQRLPGAGEGQIVAIQYPNGDAHYARNKETGEILRVDSETMVELTADEAEALGLQDWMPYTRPAETPQPVIPSVSEPMLGPRTRRDQVREGLRQIIELLPRLVDELYESPAEKLYREPEYWREEE